MRTLILKLLTILILISLSSCNIRKLNKQKFESSTTEQSVVRMQDLDHAQYEGNRTILMQDSVDALYNISIIPTDTFSFSVQHGFKGKAAKIEVSGMLRRVKSRSDSTVVHAEKQRGRAYEEQYYSEKSEKSKNRVLEKRSSPVIMVVIVLTGLIGIGWWLKRFVMQRLG